MTNCPTRAVEANWPLIEAALVAKGQGSKRSLAAAIATVTIETASTFAPVEEAYWVPQPARDAYYADTSKHAVYLGGIRYHGRGFIQTTHDYNYLAAGHHDDPDELLKPGPAAVEFARYWASRGCGEMADREDWGAVRRAVQGGLAGLERLQMIVLMLLA